MPPPYVNTAKILYNQNLSKSNQPPEDRRNTIFSVLLLDS
uniref:Uncharacterized protein n=1 Tax=Onchocerca volvulus TaxID=6282 RepID=A0A8R1Y478_ONCVO